MQAIVDHHHGDVNKTASKVRFAEPGAEPMIDENAPSPPLSDNEEKDKDDKVNMFVLLFGWAIEISTVNYIVKYRIEISISDSVLVTFDNLNLIFKLVLYWYLILSLIPPTAGYRPPLVLISLK